MDSLADNAIMLKVKAGEVDRLGLLFERHSGPLFNFLWRMTGNREQSEDLVQDVFFRVLKYRHTFRDDAQFSTWLYRIARNAHVDLLRKRKPETTLDTDEQLLPAPATQERDLLRDQDTALLLKALKSLPEDKRELLVLSRIQRLRSNQIAEILSCTAGSVRTRVHRAVADLRFAFEELAGERAQ
ncbi:MAG: sigma-70 family RNA polymerase sigma factor [bacterium]|nr:sigma-70 family RNA polymerase sigma factor [bacterium]